MARVWTASQEVIGRHTLRRIATELISLVPYFVETHREWKEVTKS